MSEAPKKHTMPFRPVRTKRVKDEREKHMTERQIAARRRQLEENRKQTASKGSSGGQRMAKLHPGQVRIGRAWRALTVDQVHDIRRKLQAGARGVDLAREYGVGQACISAIKHGRSFAWLK